ncbi:MAG: OmpA family protein [Candidatus Midichloria sp.]|nr:MAG: OmpA family protein [Candidatus Midichloria sp.]
MKKTILTVCALAMLTACAQSSSDNRAGSSTKASRALIEELTQKVGNKVYFAFDTSSLSDEAKATLTKQAELMQKYGTATFTIEGYADQRGTAEYNIGLGERRANAVKSFLASKGGVSPSRLTVISYGKERLADDRTTEEAYAKNRRAVTVAN